MPHPFAASFDESSDEEEVPTPKLPAWISRKPEEVKRRERTESEDLDVLKQKYFPRLAAEEHAQRRQVAEQLRYTGKAPRPASVQRHVEAARMMRRHLKKHQPAALQELKRTPSTEDEEKPKRSFFPKVFGWRPTKNKSNLRIVFTPSVDRNVWASSSRANSPGGSPKHRLATAPASPGGLAEPDMFASQPLSPVAQPRPGSSAGWPGAEREPRPGSRPGSSASFAGPRPSSRLAVLAYEPRFLSGPVTQARAQAWRDHRDEQEAFELEQSDEFRAQAMREQNEKQRLKRQCDLRREARRGLGLGFGFG